jgi:hypothetical protein
MLVYNFVPFIFNTPYPPFYVSGTHNSVTIQNRIHVYVNKDLGKSPVVMTMNHPVYQKAVMYNIHRPISSTLRNKTDPFILIQHTNKNLQCL